MDNGSRKSRGVSASAAVLAAIAACGSMVVSDADEVAGDRSVMTPNELRKTGLVVLLDTQILVRAKVLWEYASVKIPEDPRSMEEVTKGAGPLKMSIDTAAFEDVERSRRGLLCAGGNLAKKRDAAGREGYVVGKTDLVNGREYTMAVRIRLREGFKPELLQNPAFVKQCANPVYWSQTFQIEVLSAE